MVFPQTFWGQEQSKFFSERNPDHLAQYCHKGLCLQPNRNWDALWKHWDALWKHSCYFYFLLLFFSSLHAWDFWHWLHSTAQMFYESPPVCGPQAEKYRTRKLCLHCELRLTKSSENPYTDCNGLRITPTVDLWMDLISYITDLAVISSSRSSLNHTTKMESGSLQRRYKGCALWTTRALNPLALWDYQISTLHWN